MNEVGKILCSNESLEIRDGKLHIDGCDAVLLAKRYGTPLYVMSESQMRTRVKEIREEFLDRYPKTRAAYACKALCIDAMLRLCREEGLCIDVVSGGELYTAIKAEFPPERIEFNGNNKLPDELEMAIDYGIGRIIVDGLQELALIEDICRRKKKRTKILFRVTPGVKADSHDYIVTGKKDSKFGIPLDDEIFYPQVEKAISSEYVDFLGFHFHVGSQLFDNSPYLQALEIVLVHVEEVYNRCGFAVKEINLGGGFGAVYTREERKTYQYFLDPMMERIAEFFRNAGLEMPAVVIEPGRSIAAEAGLTLYTVGSIKDIPGVRKYVSVDGGMTDNIRPALYQAEYSGIVANKAEEPADDVATICGKCCESGDVLMRDCKITETTEAGDILAVFTTGAYGFSMASNYNRNPVPGMVFVRDGKSRLVVRRETYEDVASRDVISADWDEPLS